MLVRVGVVLRREPRTILLLLRMGAWVAVFSLAARFVTLPRALHLISTTTHHHSRETFSTIRGYHLARTLDRLLSINVFCWTPTCWKRAAILHRYLALSGRNSQVVFGVRRNEDGALAGHAWIEIEGQPQFEVCPPLYTRTFSYP